MTMGTKYVWAMRVLIRRKKGIIWSNESRHSVDSRIYMASEIRDGTLTHQNGVKGKKTFSNSNEAFLDRSMRDSRTKRLWNYTTLSTANTHIHQLSSSPSRLLFLFYFISHFSKRLFLSLSDPLRPVFAPKKKCLLQVIHRWVHSTPNDDISFH